MYNINSGGNRTKSNKNMEERVLHGAGGSDVNGIGAVSRDSGHKFLPMQNPEPMKYYLCEYQSSHFFDLLTSTCKL